VLVVKPMSIELKLKRADRIYHPGETVSGTICINSPKGSLSHQGVSLVMEGSVQLQLSAKSVGLFEAFYNSIKPVEILKYSVEAQKAGKFPQGITEVPFEFELKAYSGQEVYETYHGVFVNIQYVLKAEMKRGLISKDMGAQLEFIVEIPKSKAELSPCDFKITPETLENVKKASRKNVPNFEITGTLDSVTADITRPFTGKLTLKDTDAVIKSIELQLVRVETCGGADGFAKEATEIQNIQIADGDVARHLSIPIFMLFPRLFTCPTLAAPTFKVEFEVNLVVMLDSNHVISENFPIKLIRPAKKQ